MKKWIILCFCVLCIGLCVGHITKIKKVEYVYVKSEGIKPVTDINDPRLIRAIIKIESNFNPKARSNKGAIGLMQVRYCVWKKELKKIGIHNEKQLFHPETNIKAGKFVLAKHHVWAKGNLEQALNDYSNGKKWYVEKVLYEAMKAE